MSKAIQNILTMIEKGETSIADVRMALTSYNRLKKLGVVFYPTPVKVSVDDMTRINAVAAKYKLGPDSLLDFFSTTPYDNKPIQMIKALRERFSTGLYDSKCMMEHLYKGVPVVAVEPPKVFATPVFVQNAAKAYQQNVSDVDSFYIKHNGTAYPETKIHRIKDAKATLNMGLADAKGFVEYLWDARH